MLAWTTTLSHPHPLVLSRLQSYAAKVCPIRFELIHLINLFLAFSHDQRGELVALLEDDKSGSLNTEPSAAENEGQSSDLSAEPDLFDMLATTHNISPKVVQALAADLLKRLTSAGNQHTAGFGENLESSNIELPMAFCSSAQL